MQPPISVQDDFTDVSFPVFGLTLLQCFPVSSGSLSSLQTLPCALGLMSDASSFCSFLPASKRCRGPKTRVRVLLHG